VRKIVTLLLTIIMCLSATEAVQAENNKLTVSDVSATLSEEIYLTVALSGCDKANTLAISMDYDSEVLTKTASQCEWLKEGTIADFDAVKDKGVWAVNEKADVNGNICKLAFRVNPDAALGKTEVTCTVIVKDDSKIVDTVSATATVEVVKCVHVFNDKWTNKDAETHKQVCQKCGEEKTEAHAWDKGVVKKEPTQTAAGMKVYTCTLCKATKEEEIPATGTPQKPEDTQKPENTEKPETPQKPEDTQKPGGTEKPETPQKPEDTQKPGSTEKPETSQKPDYTPIPDYTPDYTPDEESTTPQTKPNQGIAKPSTDAQTSVGTQTPLGTIGGTNEEATGVKLDEAVVKEKAEAIRNVEEGTEFVINMKNSDNTVATVVPVEIIDAVKGKDVDVVLDLGGYSWIINGLDITSSNLSDINLEVLLDTKAIDENVLKEIAGEDETYQITLQHNGDFGFTASLKLNLGSENAGKFGNLYYYENNSKFVFMNTGLIDENGDVSLAFTHASDYVIIVGEERTADTVIIETEAAQSTEAAGTDNVDSTESEKGGNGGIIAIVAAIIAVFVAAVVFMKKKK